MSNRHMIAVRTIEKLKISLCIRACGLFVDAHKV